MTTDFKHRRGVVDSEEVISDELNTNRRLVAIQTRRNINKGLEFGANNLFKKAVEAFDAALQLSPTCAEAWMCRGLALEQLREFDLAYDAYAQAIVLTPLYDEARERLKALGPPLGRPADILTPWIERPAPRALASVYYKLRKRLGFRRNWEELPTIPGEQELREEIVNSPTSVALAVKLARRLRSSGRYNEAEHFLRYALALEPWSGDAAVLLCVILENQPGLYPVRNIADATWNAGATDERLPFIAWWNAAKECDWIAEKKWRHHVYTVLEKAPVAIPALAALHLTDDPALQQAVAVAATRSESKGIHPRSHPVALGTAGPIKLGYISADFREHAVSHLIAEVFELHDRSRFHVMGYGVFNAKESDIGRRVRGSFDRFSDLYGLAPDEAAGRIERDGIDILVDLTGHTENSPGKIMVRKPAPVQVNYLGYPGTRGAGEMDYILVDKTIVPRDHQPWFNEALVYLPDCYQPNDRKRKIGAKASRADFGLPAEGVVYCSFNESRKITPELFSSWMRILSRVPASVLWLSTRGREVGENLRRSAASAGVAPDRLIFAKRMPRHEDHMARYLHCDFFLDTVIYNGHTTTSDALWAGCPGVAFLGKTYPTRVAASLLQAVDLPELVVHSMSDYEDLAVRAGLDAEWRGALRAKLEVARSTSSLFDTPRFVQHLEWAFEHMWKRRLGGYAPASFEIPPISPRTLV